MIAHVSIPSAARLPDDTIPSELKARVCPQCRNRWRENEAPETCPADGSHLVRPDQLPETVSEADGELTIPSAAAPIFGLSGEPQTDDPMVGRTLEGRYTIIARVGAGSMGTVYRARQHAMGREVAIKILRGERAGDETAKARFMREARANSLLASPNTVTVFDFGQSETGEFYLAMELLEGENLGQRLARVGRLPAALAVDAARQALRSLGEAHAKGIIHRDLKPDNLLFARVVTGGAAAAKRAGDDASASPPANPHEEIVKVLDFGIAKLLKADEGHPMGVVETQAGTVFGTPRYMSPEQAQGKPLDARSDLYSLGVILYQMLTGRPPFTDDDAIVVMARHIKSAPKPLRDACPEASIPPELEDVVMRTLAKDPTQRPATAEILAGELLAALEAQGAMTSGVRASLTNAAGIRVPESIRPPPVALPAKAKKPWFWIAVAVVAVVVLGITIGAVAGLRQRKVDPGIAGDPSTPSASGVVATTPSSELKAKVEPNSEPPRPVDKQAEPSASSDLPSNDAPSSVTVTTPDALPVAPSTNRAGSTNRTTPRSSVGRSTTVQVKGPHSPSTTPPPSTSSSSGYGIFD